MKTYTVISYVKDEGSDEYHLELPDFESTNRESFIEEIKNKIADKMWEDGDYVTLAAPGKEDEEKEAYVKDIKKSMYILAVYEGWIESII